MKTAALLLSALLLGAAVPTAFAAEWRTETLPAPGSLGVTSLAFDARGKALVATEGFVSGRRVTAFPFRDRGGAWQAGRTLPGWGNAQLLPYWTTRTVLVRARQFATGRFDRARFEVTYAFGRSGGTLGRARVLDRDVLGQVAAVNARGDVLAAWEKGDRIRGAFRSAGRRFGRARTLSGPGASRAAVATNGRGDRIVAWYRRGWVETRTFVVGRGMGPVRRAGRARIAPSDLAATVSRGGRFVVAWGARSSTVIEHRVAFCSRTGTWRSGTLDRFARGEFRADPLALPRFDARGRALVAWVGPQGDDRVVKVGVIEGTQIRRIAALPAAAGDGLADFAASDGGALGLLAYSQETRALTASLSADGDTFAAPDTLTAAGESAVTPARLAFAPGASGGPLAVFGASTATGTSLRASEPLTP